MEHKNINQLQIMQAHIDACKASGMSVKAYCREHQIKSSNYYYWQKKLQQEQPGKFISITPLLSNAPVSIAFTNGNRIYFESTPPLDYVKKLVS
jgi:transposase-like protein